MGEQNLKLAVLHQNGWQLESIVERLRAARSEWMTRHGRSGEPNERELPSRKIMGEVVEALSSAMFPMLLGPTDLRLESEDFYVGHTLDTALNALLQQICLELGHGLHPSPEIERQARIIVQDFALNLPQLRSMLDEDVMAAFRGDPAARSVDEVMLCYPGITAIIHHRIAHHLYNTGLPLLARMTSELAHSATGIDIHPGARIGSSFFIDHGTGVVIGETAIIGDRVRIYQAVTLGAKRFESDDSGQLVKGQPRHPIVEDDVVIYSGATILGRITIGAGSSIGGNVWLTRSVPPGSNITQASLQSQTTKPE
jgi:serine O-acetyltransferase